MSELNIPNFIPNYSNHCLDINIDYPDNCLNQKMESSDILKESNSQKTLNPKYKKDFKTSKDDKKFNLVIKTNKN